MPKPGLTLIFLIFFTNYVFSQNTSQYGLDNDSQRDTKSFIIKAMNGYNRKIRFMPNYANGSFKICCLKDTIVYNDFYGVPVKIIPLNKYFLELIYAVRGGSGVGLGNMMIICIVGNKLHEALHILYYLNGEGGGEEDTYRLKISLIGSTIINYKLAIDIHDKVWSKYDQGMNYDYSNKNVLSFDVSENVFYNIKEGVYNTFKTFDRKKGEINKKVSGIYPAVVLGKNIYYFLQDGWYASGDENRLNKYSFDHN